MDDSPPDEPPPRDPDMARAARLRAIRTWTSAVTVLVLGGGAIVAFLAGYALFAVVLLVLAAFAAVDLRSLLRHRGERRPDPGGGG